jgi:hypothetical protein
MVSSAFCLPVLFFFLFVAVVEWKGVAASQQAQATQPAPRSSYSWQFAGAILFSRKLKKIYIPICY